MPPGGDDIEVEDTSREARPREGGPGAWLVLLGTVAAAIVVIGGVLAYQAWRDGDDEAAPAPTTAPADEVAEPEPRDDGTFLFRRETTGGIEVRARLNEHAMRGGVFMDDAAVPASTAVATTDGGGPEGLAMPTTPPTLPPTTSAANGEAPMPVEPLPTVVGRGEIVDPEDLPPECRIVGDLTAWAISDENVAQGGAPWTEAVPDELYPSLMWDGMAAPGNPDAESIVGVVLQVPDDVTTVQLRTPSGGADEMEPVEGAVVLAVLVPAADVQDLMGGMRPGVGAGAGYQLTAQRASGAVLTASLADAMNEPHPAWGPECQPGMVIDEPMPMPMVELPAPGAEQPADAAAAQAEIERNFALLYGPRDPAVDRSLYIDDNYGFAEASAAVERNFPGAADGASVAVHEVVFVDAANAMFRYTLTTPAADFGDQLGRARLLDGVWKITRGTLCQDMAHGGGICTP